MSKYLTLLENIFLPQRWLSHRTLVLHILGVDRPARAEKLSLACPAWQQRPRLPASGGKIATFIIDLQS